MNTIKLQDWQALPEQAQQEVYNFFLVIRQQYLERKNSYKIVDTEITAYSNHSAGNIEEWQDDSEDKVWK